MTIDGMRAPVRLWLVAVVILATIPVVGEAGMLRRYIVVKDDFELSYGKLIIEEYPAGDRYLIEKGVGCLSFWRFKYRPFYVDQSGFLDGIGDTIILPDVGQTCRVWDAELISSSPGGTLPPTVLEELLRQSFREPAAPPSPPKENLAPKVNAIFRSVFRRNPTAAEHRYWLSRTIDKSTSGELKGAMQFLKAKGKTTGSQVAGATTETGAGLPSRVNAIFRSVYGRNPTQSESKYWLSRVRDKPTEQTLGDAMKHHKAAGIRH